MNTEDDQNKKHKFKLIQGNPNAVAISKATPTITPSEDVEDIDNLIAEYQQSIIDNPTDLTIKNRLGDLCVTAGRTVEAIAYFKDIAQEHDKQEHLYKALAMYRKIALLDESDSAIKTRIDQLMNILEL